MRQIILDTETTGLEPELGHRIIEIGCIEVVNRRRTGRVFHRYLCPDREIDAGALQVHGITAEFLRGQPRFGDVVAEWLEFVRGAELVIHNAPFDVAFLDAELARLAEPPGRVGDLCQVGYLAKPGDYAALADCVDRCLRERSRLSANAREDARQRWGWLPRIQQYAEIYERTAKGWYYPRPKVSVVVTCYNLAQYLGDCIRSIQRQGFEDWECVLVDDCSTDGTAKVAALYAKDDTRIRYFRTPENLGLSGARNFGFRQALGRYILPLDADDMLGENALAAQAHALDTMPGLHIVTGCLDIVNAEGGERHRNSWPEGKFNWHAQMAHANQMIYSSMMRREVMERSGGYRTRDWRAEDAAFWCRVTSLGFRAERITTAPTLVYRDRHDSKSKGEPGDGPLTGWFPCNTAETFSRDAMKQALKKVHPRPDIVPFGAQGTPPNGKAWPVHDYSQPIVSVIIPVGPGHGKYVIDALESCVAQTFTEWEAIVVNDTGEAWPDGFDNPVAGAPYAKVVATAGRQGPAAARNEGAVRGRASRSLRGTGIERRARDSSTGRHSRAVHGSCGQGQLS